MSGALLGVLLGLGQGVGLTGLVAVQGPAPAPVEREASAPMEPSPSDDATSTTDTAGDSNKPRYDAPVSRRMLPLSLTRSTDIHGKIGVEPSTFEVAQGVSSEGRWAASISGGYPWSALRVQLGLRHGLSPLFEVQMALARRWRPAFGLAMLWLDRPRLRISGEGLVGWLFQSGELARRGPNAELRVRIAVPMRRLAPYLMLGSQHTLLTDRTTIIRPGGEERSLSLDGEWTGWATVGLAFAINKRVGIDLGVDLTWVDAPETIAIPGAHAGLIIGGFRQTRSRRSKAGARRGGQGR